jgi:uncharacterized protein
MLDDQERARLARMVERAPLKRTHMAIYGGGYIDLDGDPRVEARKLTVPIVAHSLARINRFNGHTRGTVNVAAHSIHVSSVAQRLAKDAGLDEHARRAVGRLALMHDAHEAITGDLVRPLKDMFPAVAAWESAWAYAVRDRFGLLPTHALVDEADMIALATERAEHFEADGYDWPRGYEADPLHDGYADLANPARAAIVFLQCASFLGIEGAR